MPFLSFDFAIFLVNHIFKILYLFSLSLLFLQAPPEKVRQILTDSPEKIDGVLEARSILRQLPNAQQKTFVQWMAYGAMWPISARDFLMVTAEDRYDKTANKEDGSFIIASTSIDHICDMDVDGDENLLDAYTRTNMRLAGYAGVRHPNGGTNFSLLIDLEVFDQPAWLIQMLAQYGLPEMIIRLRQVSRGAAISQAIETQGESKAAELSKMLYNIQSREARMQQYMDARGSTKVASEHMRRNSVSHAQAPLSNQRSDESDQDKKGAQKKSRIKAGIKSWLGKGDGKKVGAASSVSGGVGGGGGGEQQPSNAHAGHETKRPRGDSASEQGSDDMPPGPPPSSPAPSVPGGELEPESSEGSVIAATALNKIRQFMGLSEDSADLALDWQLKLSKSGTDVYTSMVEGSIWSAIKARRVLSGTKEDLKKLLLDDERIAEYDDMFDCAKV